MEDYKKKYEEALGWMKSIYPTMKGVDKEDAEHYFPELKESEDETMRKVAIEACKYMADNFENSTKWYEDAIAWLERLGEQKPAWSEEDYNEIETIACHLDNIGNEAMAKSLLNIMDKYKSCRPQNTWKPSDKQIKAIQTAIGIVGELTPTSMLLKELREQLKKLK